MSGQVRNRRLSSVDRLPAEADDILAWAVAQVQERRMAQLAVVKEINKRLAELGLGAISKSAFNRFVLRIEEEGLPPRLQEAAKPIVTACGSSGLPAGVEAALITLIDQRLELMLRQGKGSL